MKSAPINDKKRIIQESSDDVDEQPEAAEKFLTKSPANQTSPSKAKSPIKKSSFMAAAEPIASK